MSAYAERRPHVRWKSVCHAIVVGLALTTCGCGGGGGQAAATAGGNIGGGQGGGGQGGVQPPPVGTGTVDVTVRHAFGDPVAGVNVNLWHPWQPDVPEFDDGGITDEQGFVRFANVPAGDVAVGAWYQHAGFEMGPGRGLQHQRLNDGERIEFELVLRPYGHGPSIGVIDTPADRLSIGDSGRTLDLTVRALDEVDDAVDWDGTFEILLRDCEPDPDNDVPTTIVDCAPDPSGQDRAYTADQAGAPAATRLLAGSEATPYAAGLLVDASRRAALNDPDELRLFGLRFFLGTRLAAAHIALGAFAADDIANGEHRELPDEPLTLMTSPFAAPDADLHTAIEALAGLEGGSAPLYAALAEMLDLVDADAPVGLPRAIVVLTDGRDDNCGEPQQCTAQREALIAASQSANVRIIAVGYLTPEADQRALDELTRRSGGFTMWAEQPSQTPLLLEKIGQFLDQSTTIRELDFRILSASEGTFHSGQLVLGSLHAQFLSWGFDPEPTTVPVRIAVP